MKRWPEIWLGLVCVAAVFLVGLVGFSPAPAEGEGAAPKRVRGRTETQTDTAFDGSPGEAVSLESPETLRVVLGDNVEEMSLEEYVYAVVAAEMPAAFPEAALEAQAVAARTYALYQRQSGKHGDVGGDVCGESTCCQAFITQAELDARWEGDGAFYTQKLRGAVARTAGEVLTYDGGLAAAVYHASSDGSTRSAAEVWGGAQPYLTAVDTPEETGSKGHGVGMSQRGAQALAQEGADYREILGHYYQGIEITALG